MGQEAAGRHAWGASHLPGAADAASNGGTAPCPVFVSDDGEPDGCALGAVVGTSWHGVLEGDEVRGALLARVGARHEFPAHHERRSSPPLRRSSPPFRARRSRQLDLLAEAAAEAIDASALESLIAERSGARH